jgi:hypothetical protein
MTNRQIYEWLEEQDYPINTWGWSDERAYRKHDMPRILREFMDYYLAQKSRNEAASD